MLPLSRFSFGVGDRFAHQAASQLKAFQQLEREGCLVIPVWNKSNREHTFIGSEPASVRSAAAAAVHQLGWPHAWHVDADHIRLDTVDRFLEPSDFFTIDVADSIGTAASDSDVTAFLSRHSELNAPLSIPGIDTPLQLARSSTERTVRKYLAAVQEAGRIHRYIESKRGDAPFIAEVSMDETDQPQTPDELLIILAALADEQIPLQTIAPKFTGRFNKGVDYEGDLHQFEKEFRDDLVIIEHAIARYGLPENLKLSIHSGSDKFSLYPIVHRAIMEKNAGLHVKTAGTTWLEELIGLSEAGGDGLELVNELYDAALQQIDALCGPYASVIDIRRDSLPSLAQARSWTGPEWAGTLRHLPSNPRFHSSLRQLMHVAFKLAAKTGNRFTDLLESNADIVGENVFLNLHQRHMKPLFLGSG